MANIKPVRKLVIKTKDITQSGADSIRNIFFSGAPLEDGYSKKIEENRIIFTIPKSRNFNRTSAESSIISGSYIYHNFSFLTPTNDINNQYSYEINCQNNLSLIGAYEQKLREENISTENNIKNFYTINNIETYYSGKISPGNTESWDQYREYLFHPKTLRRTFDTTAQIRRREIVLQGNPTKIASLPIYNEVKIPALQGLKISDLAKSFMIDAFNTFDSVFSIDSDKLTLLNYLNLAAASPKVDILLNNSGRITPIKVSAIDAEKAMFSDTGLSDSSARQTFAINRGLFIASETYSPEQSIPNIFLNLISQVSESPLEYFKKFTAQDETNFYPLFYKISKIPIAPTRFNSSIEDFYIPADLDAALNFIDNQILPSKLYDYSISIIGISCGFTYKYSNFTEGAFTFSFELNSSNCFRNIKILEVPFFRDSALLTREMPVIPEPTIVSLMGEPNKLKIFLNTKSSNEKPISINNREKIVNDTINSVDGTLKYNNFNFESFIVYKLHNQPSSYEDFNNAETVILPKSRNAFYDEIMNNKKYYYMFRTVVGNFFSNPSEIIEVEIKNENGVIVPFIKNFFFEAKKSNLLSDEREFKTMVSLEPSFYQLNLVEVASSSNSTFIGSKYDFDRTPFKNLESIFENSSRTNPSYKLRLISKTTGKMVDINIRYKYTFK